MNITIGTVIYRNYSLLDLQIKQWNRILDIGGVDIAKDRTPDFDLIAIDNTPINEVNWDYTKHVYHLNPHNPLFDGVSHGEALDKIVSLANCDILGLVDSDFFWLDTNILNEVKEYFKQGYKCVGAAGFYPDWQSRLDPLHPDRAGHLAPVCYGMFVDPKLAAEQTFVCTPEEGAQIKETGWRLRERLIKEDIPRITYQGCNPVGEDDKECCFFYQGDKVIDIKGVHFLKGSSGRMGLTDRIPEILERWTTK